MNIPDTIKCALCGCSFLVKKFATGKSVGDVTVCQQLRSDGTICGRIFQHAGVMPKSERIEMRVSPDEIRQIWHDSKGLFKPVPTKRQTYAVRYVPFSAGWRAHALGQDICPYERDIDALEWASGWDARKKVVEDGIVPSLKHTGPVDGRVDRRGGVA